MECESCTNSDFEAKLEVNGETIELNTFVENFISQAIIGMLKSLRGVDDVESIDLKISKKSKSS